MRADQASVTMVRISVYFHCINLTLARDNTLGIENKYTAPPPSLAIATLTQDLYLMLLCLASNAARQTRLLITIIVLCCGSKNLQSPEFTFDFL